MPDMYNVHTHIDVTNMNQKKLIRISPGLFNLF